MRLIEIQLGLNSDSNCCLFLVNHFREIIKNSCLSFFTFLNVGDADACDIEINFYWSGPSA